MLQEKRTGKIEARCESTRINPNVRISCLFMLFLPLSFSILFLLASSLFGSTYDISALSLGQLTRASDVVVVGEVGGSPDARGRDTTTIVIVREVLKGMNQVRPGQKIRVVTLSYGQIPSKKNGSDLFYLNRVRNSDPKSEALYTLTFEGFGVVPLTTDEGQRSGRAGEGVKSEAEEIISAARKYVSLFSSNLSSTSLPTARQASSISYIGRYKDVIMECINSRNPRVCVSACVDMIRNPKIAEMLRKNNSDMDVLIKRFTHTRDRAIKNYLAKALGATGSKRAVPALIDSLCPVSSGDADSNSSSANVHEFSREQSTELMSIRNRNVVPTASVARALKSIGDPTTVTQLVRKLRQSKDDADGRVAIVNTIGVLGGDSATRALLRRIRDKDRRVRLAAALALARINPSEAVTSFGRILNARTNGVERQRDPDMQKLAIVILAKIASKGIANGHQSSGKWNVGSKSTCQKAEKILNKFSENHENEDIGKFAAKARLLNR